MGNLVALAQERERIPCVDVWFEMHKRFLENPGADGKEYGDWLRERPFVYMQARTPQVPNSYPYPKEHMLAAFGRWFFNSTLSWMLALAVSCEPKTIGMWGIQASAGEYAAQRPSILAFAQIAHMRGIEVIAPNSQLLDDEMLYGYDQLV